MKTIRNLLTVVVLMISASAFAKDINCKVKASDEGVVSIQNNIYFFVSRTNRNAGQMSRPEIASMVEFHVVQLAKNTCLGYHLGSKSLEAISMQVINQFVSFGEGRFNASEKVYAKFINDAVLKLK